MKGFLRRVFGTAEQNGFSNGKSVSSSIHAVRICGIWLILLIGFLFSLFRLLQGDLSSQNIILFAACIFWGIWFGLRESQYVKLFDLETQFAAIFPFRKNALLIPIHQISRCRRAGFSFSGSLLVLEYCENDKKKILRFMPKKAIGFTDNFLQELEGRISSSGKSI